MPAGALVRLPRLAVSDSWGVPTDRPIAESGRQGCSSATSPPAAKTRHLEALRPRCGLDPRKPQPRTPTGLPRRDLSTLSARGALRRDTAGGHAETAAFTRESGPSLAIDVSGPRWSAWLQNPPTRSTTGRQSGVTSRSAGNIQRKDSLSNVLGSRRDGPESALPALSQRAAAVRSAFRPT